MTALPLDVMAVKYAFGAKVITSSVPGNNGIEVAVLTTTTALFEAPDALVAKPKNAMTLPAFKILY
jgi:hypothetical protein